MTQEDQVHVWFDIFPLPQNRKQQCGFNHTGICALTKLSKKMGLMTLNDPTAQCQSPYSLGSLGSAKTEGRNSVDSMTLYNPSTTTQSLLPYSPGNGLNGKQTLYGYQHLKQYCH